MYDQSIGITWKGDEEPMPFITWKDRSSGKTLENPLSPNRTQCSGRNVHKIVIPADETVVTEFHATDTFPGCTLARIRNPGNQLSQPRHLRELLIAPSLSDWSKDSIFRAQIHNYSPVEKIINQGEIIAIAEPECPESVQVIGSPNNPTHLSLASDDEGSLQDGMVNKQVISNLPRRVRKILNKLESQYHSAVQAYDRQVRISKAQASAPIKDEIAEKLMSEIFRQPGDEADLELEPGEELGFDLEESVDVLDQFDMSLVRPQYRCFVRKLLSDHESLFAKSDLDCGNISLTLGTYSLPLKKPLPHTTHRTYFMQGDKKRSLKIILSLMLRNGLIKRVKAATFSSPVFLLHKKNKASLPRLLADVRLLNEHLTPVHQLVPKIQSLLEDIGTAKPVLFSSMDLASAFFSMQPDQRTQRMLTLSTQFGLFAARVGVQGVSHIFPDSTRRGNKWKRGHNDEFKMH